MQFRLNIQAFDLSYPPLTKLQFFYGRSRFVLRCGLNITLNH